MRIITYNLYKFNNYYKATTVNNNNYYNKAIKNKWIN